MNRALIAAVVAIVVAGGAWYLLSDRGSDKNESGEKADESTQETKPDLSARREASDRAGRRDNPEASVLFDDDPTGSLQLEGRVVAENDEGVEGATVSINSNPPRRVRTEGDGSFAFAKLVGRNYRIVARHPRGVAGPIAANLTETNDPVTLKLRPSGSVRVTVLASGTSKPIRDASVELRGIDRQTASTDKKGVASFAFVPSDRYEVVAQAPGFSPQHARARVDATGTGVSVRMTLKSGAPVRGLVVGHDGKPLAGARVIYSGASDWSQRANPRWDAAESGPDGRFEFAALPAGTFRFTARAKGRAPGRSELKTLDGTSALEDVRIQMGEGATLRGRVLTSGGKPVPAARVRVNREGAGFRARVRESFADDQGNYEIEGLERESIEVVAIGPDASSEVAPVDFSKAPHERTIDIILEVDGAIAGVVVDGDGLEVEGAQVWAFPDFRSNNRRVDFRLRGVPRVLTDAGGHFKLTGVPAGKFMVRASRSQLSGRAGWLIEPAIAEAGDTEVRIELAKEGGIKGKVAFATGEAPGAFSVNLGGWGGGTPFSSKDGSFELPEIAPQKYTITIRGPGFDSKQLVEVQIEAGKTKDLGTITIKKGRVLVGNGRRRQRFASRRRPGACGGAQFLVRAAVRAPAVAAVLRERETPRRREPTRAASLRFTDFPSPTSASLPSTMLRAGRSLC